MGSFSWLRADSLTKYRNIAHRDSFKFLIPKEFGGGFIKDKYQDYGYLGHKKDGTPKYDIYELLAFWNAESSNKQEELRYDGELKQNKMKEIDKFTEHNRVIGINIGCYNEDIDNLKYPPKLVSASYKGNYEDLENYSYGDPDQGFWKTLR